MHAVLQWLRDRGWHLPEWRWKEELVRAWSEKHSERIVENAAAIALLSREPALNVLDIGCRYSLLPLQLASLGYDVTGIDIHPCSIAHPRFRFIKADIRTDAVTGGPFDAALCISTLEHIGLGFYGEKNGARGDIEAAHRIRSLLKPDGLLIFTVGFGTPMTGTWYRSYDEKGLRALCDGWRNLTIQTYRRCGKYWEKAPMADCITYDNGRKMECVAVCTARA